MVLAFVLVILTQLISLKTADAQCGGVFTELSGVLTSPNFPSDYPNKSYCVYNITVPLGYRIHLVFTQFDLEIGPNNTCIFDYVQIREGVSITLKTFCNASVTSPQRTFGNSMFVIFRSDDNTTGSGFRALYNAATNYPDASFLVATAESSVGQADGAIVRIDVETVTNYALPFTSTIANPMALGYDHVTKRVYWTEYVDNNYTPRRYTIRYGNINGGQIGTVLDGDRVSVLEGLAVDSLSRLLFYSDGGLKVIGVIRLANFSRKFVISTNLERPLTIALDTHDGVMFWTDWGTLPKIERSNYDGTERRTLVNTQLYYIFALALDFDYRRLYWGDAGTDRVEFSDFNGQGRTVVQQRTNSAVFGMVFYQNGLYLTDWAFQPDGVIFRLSLATGNTTTFATSYRQLNGICISFRQPSLSEPNGCGLNNGGCSEFCIPLPGNRSKCECLDDQVLLSDRKTCINGSAITVRISSTPALPLDTDSSLQLTLTCTPVDVTEDSISYTWSVSCLRQTGNTCSFVPRPPEDDGKEVTCYARFPTGQTARGSITLDLNYPPKTSPQIWGYSGEMLEMGNRVTLTCTVRGGKPLVTSVIFSCDGHFDNPRDFRGSDLVESYLTLSPVKAEDKNQRCTCTAEWKITEWYKLSAWTILNVNNTQTLTSPSSLSASPSSLSASPNAVIPIAAGAGGGGLLLLIVLIVVIICLVRKRRDKTAGNGTGRNKNYLNPEPYPDTSNETREHDYVALTTVSAAVSQGNHHQGLQRQDSQVYHSIDDTAVSAADNPGFREDCRNYLQPITAPPSFCGAQSGVREDSRTYLQPNTAPPSFCGDQPAPFLQGDSYGALRAPPQVAPKPNSKCPPLPAREQQT